MRPRQHPPPGIGPEDAEGQIIEFHGVKYVLDKDGHSAELARAMAQAQADSDEIGRAMREATSTPSPYGNPYKR